MIFENPQIDIEQLPQIEQVVYKKLAPAFKSTEYIGTIILYIFLFIGASILFFNTFKVLGFFGYGIFVIWALMFLVSLLLVSKKFEMAGYALREHDVIHKHGVWWHTVTAIPFIRMQHCEISQGPIQNIFGLATIRIFTAGGTNSDLAIDGLEQEEAKRIKDFITGKISGHPSSDNPPSPALGEQAEENKREEWSLEEPPTTIKQAPTTDNYDPI